MSSDWQFNGDPFSLRDHPGAVGFCYCIKNLRTGELYIGKKQFSSKPSWEKYWSSCAELKEEVKTIGSDNFERHILTVNYTLGDLNICETRLLFLFNVLETKKFYNQCILGKYFRQPRSVAKRVTCEALEKLNLALSETLANKGVDEG